MLLCLLGRETKEKMYTEYCKTVGADRVGQVAFNDMLKLLIVGTRESVGLSDRFRDWLHLGQQVEALYENMRDIGSAL